MRTRLKYSVVYFLVLMLFTSPIVCEAFSARAAFVGNTVVDLDWDYSCCSFDYYRVLRDGVETATISNSETTFYRDDAVSKGEEYTYQVCQVNYPNSTSQSCSSEFTVTVGEVKGSIHQDLTWSSGLYELHGYVYVENQATLSVQPGVTITGVFESEQGRRWRLYGKNGQLQLEGATIDGIGLTLNYGSNWIKNSSITAEEVSWATSGYNPIIIEARDDSHLELSGNEFLHADIRYYSQAGGLITDNEFDSTSLWTSSGVPQVNITISNNRFLDGHLGLSGDATVLVENNSFTSRPEYQGQSAISMNLASSSTIRGNSFSLNSAHGALSMDNASNSVIENNSIENCSSGLSVGVPGAVYSESPGLVTLTGNSISSCIKGVELYTGTSTLTSNNIQSNDTGIYLYFGFAENASATIHQNCLTDNASYGVASYGELTTVVDATNNWWGDDSGPTTATNPGGSGDAIFYKEGVQVFGAVSYGSWLTVPNCQSNTTLPVKNIAPTIAMAPSEDYTFQANILEKKGFILTIHDDDGIKTNDDWNIDWNKFRVYVDEINVTGEFLTVLAQRKLLVFTLQEKEIKLLIKPDPEKFMTEDNLFHITKNGLHTIAFGICDTGGLCGQATYKLYFGPFALLTGPVAVIMNTKHVIKQLIPGIFFGNIGYATRFDVYCVIHNNNTFKSLHLEGKEYLWDEKILHLISFWADDLTTGVSVHLGGQLNALPALKLTLDDVGPLATFYLGIKDKNTGQFSIDHDKFSVK